MADIKLIPAVCPPRCGTEILFAKTGAVHKSSARPVGLGVISLP